MVSGKTCAVQIPLLELTDWAIALQVDESIHLD